MSYENTLVRLKESSISVTGILTIVYGIATLYFAYSGPWNLVYAIIALITVLVTIYVLMTYYESQRNWKGTSRLWASLIACLAHVTLFLHYGGLI